MGKKKYIHYGHKEFLLDRFHPIVNIPHFVKPRGGLWASPVDAEIGWKDWCEDNDFHCDRLEDSFSFTLRDDARVLHIASVENLTDLPEIKNWHSMWYTLDFEKLMETYDAVELELFKDFSLYWRLYGWDCDSILIMNPYVVEVEDE